MTTRCPHCHHPLIPSWQTMRDKRRAAGLCAECQKKSPETYRCTECRAKAAKQKKARESKVVQ